VSFTNELVTDTATRLVNWRGDVILLWPPYEIGQAIIFVPCGFYLLSITKLGYWNCWLLSSWCIL